MAHFFAQSAGARGSASRLGTASSGVEVTAASWQGALRVRLAVDAQGRDTFHVEEIPWHGAGVARVIASGIIGQGGE